MANYPAEYGPPSLPRPGKVVTTAMGLTFGLWLAFAIGVHWAGVGADAFELFCGNTLLILHGQVWRLFTAPLLQSPEQGWHLFGVLLTLYFFGVPLEKSWGPARLTRFLISLAVLASLVEVLFDIALPPSVGQYFAQPYWYGGLAVANVDTNIASSILGVSNQGSAVHTGWTAGAGVEFKVAPRFSLGLEFMHTNLGRSKDISGASVPGATESYGVGVRTNSFMARFNYLFGGR